MDFVIDLLNLTNWKSKIYNFILVIVNKLIKMIYYELVKITIDIPRLAKVIFDKVV